MLVETPIISSATVNHAVFNDAPRMFDESDFPVGTVAHQGDVILVRISALPKSAKTRESRQIAEGNTQGSRHVVMTGDVFDCDLSEVAKAIKSETKCDVNTRYIGPVFKTVDGCADLDHPEHGNHQYRGDMVMVCVFQRVMDAEEREQRAAD